MRGKMRQCEELKKIFFYRNDEQMMHFFRGLKTDGSNIFVGSHLSNLNILPFLSLFLNICFLSAFNIALDSIQMSRLFRNQRFCHEFKEKYMITSRWFLYIAMQTIIFFKSSHKKLICDWFHSIYDWKVNNFDFTNLPAASIFAMQKSSLLLHLRSVMILSQIHTRKTPAS